MAPFSIRQSMADEELKARVLELTIGSKTVKTPSRALYFHPNDQFCESEAMHKKPLRGINEIYIQRDFEAIQELRTNVAKQTRLISSYDNAYRKSGIGNDELVYTFIHYDARHQNQRKRFLDPDPSKKKNDWKPNPEYIETRLPTRDEIDYLVRLYASFPSDVLATPILQNTDGDTYIQLLNQFFEIKDTYSEFKSKPIMGVIPKVSDLELPKILEFYDKKGIRLYAMDFVGGQPLHYRPNLISIMKHFKSVEDNYKELCYLHGVNVRYGRMMEKDKVPARDVLSYGAGIDSFGVAHLAFGGTEIEFEGTPEQKKKLQLKEGLKKAAVFNRGDYGYHRLHKNRNLKGIFESDDKNTIYNIQHIKRAKSAAELKARIRIFNAERHAIEANHLVKDVVGQENMKKYLVKKASVDAKTLRELTKISEGSRQATL